MKKTISKILIANRGEIAVRVIKTARKLNIKTVAIYSEADSTSLAVKMADESYFIGPSPSNQSYLNVDKIIEVVKLSGADAVHPGYGFLSENSAFAEKLEELGVEFIGPGREAILAMGDKITSKKIAIAAGVNTVPGYMGVIKDTYEAQKISDEIGFPVMIKATAGGGGRGMRIVHRAEDVADAFLSASKEAKNSFGDDRIFIEKFIENPRHIEIQVLGDKYGNIICLGERECSIQRYNQKVIEEAPSPFLTEEIRQKMYEQSRSLAANVNYHSVGTVEYIVDQDKKFYFLEMNTRLQVEHPVTEMVTGLDLVEEMINVAEGKKLKLTQEEVKLTGWAFESRIYAEDPARGFLPSSGRVFKYCEPEESDYIRIDSGVYEGSEISMFYDPMIAKLCSYGETRNDAITNMNKALGEMIIRGVSHNIGFLGSIFSHQRFIDGNLSTSYIAQEYPDGYKLKELVEGEYSDIIYAATIIRLLEAERNGNITGKIDEKEINTRWSVCVNDGNYIVEITRKEENSYSLFSQGKRVKVKNVNWSFGSPLFKAIINDVPITLKFRKRKATSLYRFHCLGGFLNVSVVTPRVAELMKYMPEKKEENDMSSLKAPISGKVVSVKVSEGEKIKAGTELVVLEAMKMENALIAEFDAEIKKICVPDGQVVAVDEVLIEFVE